jgi:hypothetical protein
MLYVGGKFGEGLSQDSDTGDGHEFLFENGLSQFRDCVADL